MSEYFDLERRGPGCGFLLWFAFCALLALVLIGVGVWAGVELVQWVTSK